MIRFTERVARHVRLTKDAYQRPPSPPLLVLFVNSICNMQCEHCFYWRNLNRRDDLTFEELEALSVSLGRVENLNLSGGEPFLRKEIGAICRQFIRRNETRQIYVPTNGYFTDRTVAAVEDVLSEPTLALFAVELSLDGTAAFHDEFRVSRGSFERAMKTYDALAEIQRRDPRLRIHSVSTATHENIDEIRKLTKYLFERCPRMDHHNLAMIRGDRKNPDLAAPLLDDYQKLYAEIQRLWAPREKARFGAVVEPLLQWTKGETLRKREQVAPCVAGKLTAVVYSNGDVSVCEMHEPLGNLREHSFPELWASEEAAAKRRSIAEKQCWCTTEVFLWPSIVFQPPSLLRAAVGHKLKAPARG